MTGTPFIVIPWQNPFLPSLLELVREHAHSPGDAVLIFPHARPGRYMDILIREHSGIGKPCIMPRVETVSSLFSLVRAQAEQRPALTVGALDQIALLLACVRDLRDSTAGGLLQNLPLHDPKRFFPWGIRLAALMEDFFTHARLPGDYSGMEGNVSAFAAALLENLSSLHARYMEELDKRCWTTPGYDAFKAARCCRELRHIHNITDKTVFLAGFHTLTGTQELLFRHLWEQHGAFVCLHADAAVADTAPHWSCMEFVRWSRRWQTRITVYGEVTEQSPAITYKAGYDLHSQLAALSGELVNDLRENETLRGAAIILQDTGLLLPVLHHLPRADVNISMGYPLSRSSLFHLLHSILRLQETRRGQAPEYEYHWKACIALIRHPYLKMLRQETEEEEETESGLRRLLRLLEERIRTGRRFTRLDREVEHLLRELDPEIANIHAQELLRGIMSACVANWRDPQCAEDLAGALDGLTSLLLRHGRQVLSSYPIDAECLFRLMQSVMPALAHTELKNEHLPAATLFAMLRELLRAERVPFEADPLVGLQVMGMLETRLLHFTRLYILDATDDNLPGQPHQDPLLPDALRALAGLPDNRGRECLVAYNFFRLLAAADNVTLFWQEGVAPGGLAEGKKLRSRFIEELLWKAEQKAGRLFDDRNADGLNSPLHTISCRLPPPAIDNAVIPVTPAVRKGIARLLDKDISPSLLDAYLRCPVRCFYERLCRIQSPEEVVEGDDPIAVGTLLHSVLQEYFSTRLGVPINNTTGEKKALKRLFLQRLADSDLSASLPLESRIMLEESGPVRLARMLENQVGSVPVQLEERLRAPIAVNGKRRTLAGILDRVDQRDNGHVILDYKTGYIPLPGKRIWQNAALWDRLRHWEPDSPEDDDPLPELASLMKSVQLPAYIHLYAHGTGQDVADAAYVALRDTGKDCFLFHGNVDEEEKITIINKQIPELLSFILRHMEECARVAPHPGQQCDYCPCKGSCCILPR